jgi:hypothetical protein
VRQQLLDVLCVQAQRAEERRSAEAAIESPCVLDLRRQEVQRLLIDSRRPCDKTRDLGGLPLPVRHDGCRVFSPYLRVSFAKVCSRRRPEQLHHGRGEDGFQESARGWPQGCRPIPRRDQALQVPHADRAALAVVTCERFGMLDELAQSHTEFADLQLKQGRRLTVVHG